MKSKNGVPFGLLSGIFWGLGLTVSAYIFSIFTDLSPFVVAATHDFLSIFILLAFLLVKEGKVRLSIFLNIRNVSVIIGALLAGPIGMQANLYAVKYIGSSLASSVSAIYPAISVLLAFFFLKHKISKNTVFGIVLIIGGIIAQTYKVEQVNSFYIGILCALVCAIAWGSESVLSSFAMESELSEIEALLIRQVTSFLSYLVIVLFSHQSFVAVANGQLLGLMIVFVAFDMISYLAYYIAINRLQPAKATGLNVSYVVWTVFFAALANGQLLGLMIVFVAFDMISYLAYYIAINRLQPAKATGLNVSYVVWTVLFAALFLGTSLDMLTIMTSLVVIAGVYIIIKE
ncbi:drug/metabolite transporter (DMT) superfamily permease [Streptococcus pneumoniae]|uniref:DMT family transporter n=4 Tax=Streptococcus pneumoniae TaxID=1313 RepID=UPI0005E273B6|nr:drug/metabolite transporter (DMT) superfamily permease [Streptococcus pneumoniae]